MPKILDKERNNSESFVRGLESHVEHWLVVGFHIRVLF